MSSFRLIIFSILLLFSWETLAEKADDYWLAIHERTEKIRAEILPYYLDLVKSDNAELSEPKRIQLLETVNSTITFLENKKPFKNDANFRDQILGITLEMKAVLADYCSELIDYELFAEKSYQEMEKYVELKWHILLSFAETISKYDDSEQDFISSNKLGNESKVNEGIQARLKLYNSAYGVYFPVYLICFKAKVAETHLILALVNKKLDDVEPRRLIMLDAANRGLEELENQLIFNLNDSALLVASKRLLAFYQDEAETEILPILEFYRQEESFKELERLYHAKNELTEREVEAYNKSKGMFEKQKADFEIIIERTNLFRSDRLTVWEEERQRYLKVYFPN